MRNQSKTKWSDNLMASINKKIKLNKIQCINCNTEIIEYFNNDYNGYRGKCLICKTDFPLDQKF